MTFADESWSSRQLLQLILREQRRDLAPVRRMISAIVFPWALIANFGFDTAKNEPLKMRRGLQKQVYLGRPFSDLEFDLHLWAETFHSISAFDVHQLLVDLGSLGRRPKVGEELLRHGRFGSTRSLGWTNQRSVSVPVNTQVSSSSTNKQTNHTYFFSMGYVLVGWRTTPWRIYSSILPKRSKDEDVPKPP